ncbi:MAG: hypothetical protein RIU67_462, partial [Actinomycetota bacterium]
MTAGPIYERPGLRVVDDESIGHFVVSDTPIESGETIVIWAGAEITLVEALALTPKEQDYLLQVDD